MHQNEVVGVLCNGTIFDLHTKPNYEEKNCKPIKIGDFLALEIIRHSFAHVLAQALKRIYKQVSFHTGPTTHSGFFYDVLLDQSISSHDLPRIQKEMKKIIEEKLPFEKKEIKKEDFFKIFDDSVKNTVFNKIEAPIYIYTQGEFTDLCRGPHVLNTGILNTQAFELTQVSGVKVGNFDLQRIEGIAFFTKEELENYKTEFENSKKNDHRIVGANLFFNSELSTGCVFWTKYGYILFQIIENFIRKQYAEDYEEIKTPPMLKQELWQLSGHMDSYSENMFIHEDCVFKPMNCPAHVLYFKHLNPSYKDLPMRLAEFGCCFRKEEKGGLIGLKRLRYFTQDDAHIFCLEEQIQEEITKFIKFALKIYETFGFHNTIIKIATRPDVYTGELELWNKAEKMLEDAVKILNLDFLIVPGDGAFYGPKIELHLKDNLGKYWQCGTIQLDFGLSQKLDATYTDNAGEKKHPIILHRAAIGTIERFIGVLLENYKGKLPSWLNPIQCYIIPIKDEHINYAEELYSKLKELNFRVVIDKKNNTLSKKLKIALQNHPYCTAIIGDEEITEKNLTIRHENQSQKLNFEQLLKFLK